MEGAPSPTAGPMWRARGAPIPSTVDPGRAEQTRPMAAWEATTAAASCSFESKAIEAVEVRK
jgi:hypothetical protein